MGRRASDERGRVTVAGVCEKRGQATGSRGHKVGRGKAGSGGAFGRACVRCVGVGEVAEGRAIGRVAKEGERAESVSFLACGGGTACEEGNGRRGRGHHPQMTDPAPQGAPHGGGNRDGRATHVVQDIGTSGSPSSLILGLPRRGGGLLEGRRRSVSEWTIARKEDDCEGPRPATGATTTTTTSSREERVMVDPRGDLGHKRPDKARPNQGEGPFGRLATTTTTTSSTLSRPGLFVPLYAMPGRR